MVSPNVLLIHYVQDLAPMKMWETLIELSKSDEDEIKQYGLWIIGTAIQNNPKAQHTVNIGYYYFRILHSLRNPIPRSSIYHITHSLTYYLSSHHLLVNQVLPQDLKPYIAFLML